MIWLVGALLGEALFFGFTIWINYECNGELGWRRFWRPFLFQVSVVVILTVAIWWYWYPLQSILNFDFGKFAREHRPKP